MADVNQLLSDLFKRVCIIEQSLKGTGLSGGLWSLVGNEDISDESFLGTTDNNDLVFRTNSIERARVTPLGLIGIGTDTPTTILDVNGQIRLRGGAPGAGKVLTSDANGVGSWTSLPVVPISAANNGLHVTGTTVKLGGSVIDGTTIISMATSSDRLLLTGTVSNTAFATLGVINSGVGYGIIALNDNAGGGALAAQNTAVGGTSLYAVSGDGIAIAAYDGGTGIGIDTRAVEGLPLRVTTDKGNDNATSTAILIERTNGTTTGTGGTGMGADILVQMETNVLGNIVTSAKISSYWTSAVLGAETSALDFWTRGGGIFDSKMSIKSTGQIQLTKYTGAGFTGTVDKILAVDASGNIIVTTGGSSSSIIPFISTDFDPDGITVTDTSLNGKTYELFFNDLNRFLYNEVGNQEWDYVVGGGYQILIPGFDANVNTYHLYLMFK